MATVFLTREAERDLDAILAYITAHDGREQAEDILDRLEDKVLSLEDLPERGNHPPELERIGVLAFRELHESPYRIIYQPLADAVYVHAILDGRRDMQSLLEERLLRS